MQIKWLSSNEKKTLSKFSSHLSLFKYHYPHEINATHNANLIMLMCPIKNMPNNMKLNLCYFMPQSMQ